MKAVEGWNQISIGEFVDLINGFAFPSEGFTEGEGKPLIRIRDLERQKTEVNFRGKYNDCYLVKKDDLLIGMDGDFQTVKWKGSDALLNQRVCKLITKSPKVLIQDFLFYRIIEEILHIHRITTATTVKHLSSKDVLGIKIDIPSKPEQTKIAEILSTVDRAIEQTEAIIAKQQRIKTGLMQDLLTRGIDEHGNIRSEETHEFKDSSLGRIPVKWHPTHLGESCQVCNNLRKPISAQVRETMMGDYPYYGPTGVLDYINEYRVEGKYILIGEDGDHFLKFATNEMTLLVDGRFNVNNHAHLIRGKGNVLTEWLHLFFLHRDITLYLTRQGAGRLKLNKAALLDLPMTAPKYPKEQRRILKVMDTFRLGQTQSLEKLRKLCSLKTALMQDILTGKVRVTPILNEPKEDV